MLPVNFLRFCLLQKCTTSRTKVELVSAGGVNFALYFIVRTFPNSHGTLFRDVNLGTRFFIEWKTRVAACLYFQFLTMINRTLFEE